jgi:hypothetical protein
MSAQSCALKGSPEYVCRLGDAMPDQCVVWRRRGKAAAFGMCLVHGDAQYAEYRGFDDGVALDLRLYHYVFRDLVRGASRTGTGGFKAPASTTIRSCVCGRRLKPVDLYVRHTYPLINTILRVALRSREPTRHDDTLKKFPN